MVDKWGLTGMISLVVDAMQLLLAMDRVLVGCDDMRLKVRAGTSFIQ